MSTYPEEFKALEEENKKLQKVREVLQATKIFLLRLEAIGICGKISTTRGHIYTMRKKIEQTLK